MFEISTGVCILIIIIGIAMIFLKMRRGFAYILLGAGFLVLNAISQDISLTIAIILAVIVYEKLLRA